MERSNYHIPIVEVNSELYDIISACANRAIEIAADRSISSNYYIGYDQLSDIISKEDYDKYFDDIADAVVSREEVLDLETADGELNMIIGTAWCKSYEPDWEDEFEEKVVRELMPYLSLTEKARRYDLSQELEMRTINDPYFNEMGSRSLLDSYGIMIMTNIYGQPILGGELSSWEAAAVEKFIGPKPWHEPPKDFHPLVALDHNKPAIMYSRGLVLDENDDAPFHGDLGFMNAVALMTAKALQKEGALSDHFKFGADISSKESESAEIFCIMPATVSETPLARAISKLDDAMSSPVLPLNDLSWCKAQYDTVVAYFKNQIPDIIRQFPKVRPEWIERSIPEMAGLLCASIYDEYGQLSINKPVIDPAKLTSFISDYKILSETCYKLVQPITLTTYASPEDSNYNLTDDETPTVTFDIPYGALREILAKDAPHGESPLSVEEFLDLCTYDYNELIRGAYEDMQRKPNLTDQLKGAEERKNGQITGKNILNKQNEKEL